jgi:GxxExxY protein
LTESTEKLADLTEKIIGAAIEVHRQTRPGLMESAYEECLCYEFSQMGLSFERQVQLPITYNGVKLDCGYKMNLVVEDSVVLELKTEKTSFSPQRHRGTELKTKPNQRAQS